MLLPVLRVVGALVFLLAGNAGLADQPTLLNVDSGTLAVGGTSVGAQELFLDAVQRGVTAGGASRVPSPFGWALNADPAAIDEVGSRYFGPIDLMTGAVLYADTQLVLPAYASWPIGISYSSAQSEGRIGEGMQGNNWFQATQPSITNPGSGDIIRLFYAANAFVEYKRVDSSDYFVGINGAGGVMHKENSPGDEEVTQVYRLLDQAGTEIVFFGFGGESAITGAGAAGQFWKYTVGAGTGGSKAVAYVGHKDKPWTAASSGYSNGRIILAKDSVDRSYVYTYAGVGGVDRLTSVVATKTVSGTPTTVATVEYAYYGQAGITTGTNNGKAGDLARVRIILPTSFSGVDDVRENRFYYASDSRLKLVLGYEGTRRYLVDAGSSPVDWNADATALAAALNSRAEWRVAYPPSGSSVKVESAWFAGMDGNNGQPSGGHQFAFEGNGNFDPPAPWQSRAIIKLPPFSRFAGTGLGTPAEGDGNTWMTRYFDALGQPLHSVVSDADPGASGSPRVWVTGVVRDANNRLKSIHTPANCSGYNHTATNSTRGSYTKDASAGLVTYFEREGAGEGLDGMVSGVRRGAGVGPSADYANTKYVSWGKPSLHEATLSSGSPTIKLRRPVVEHSRTYPVATGNYATAGSYDETTYEYTWWGSSPETMIPRTVQTSPPAVSTDHNGSGTSNVRKTWFNHFGQAIVTKLPNGRLDTSEYDSATGLLIKQTTDAPTPTETNFTGYAELPTSGAPAATVIAGESTPYGVQTTYGRDALGRVVQTTGNAESATSRTSQSYYARLADRRIVRLDVPAVDLTSTPVYYGPISATVVNHLGVVEESGLISPSDPTAVQDASNPSRFSTTSDPGTWLATPSSTLGADHLTTAQHAGSASGSPAIVSLSTLVTSLDGSRVIEARRYTAVPSTGEGAVDTHYDRTLTRYNGMGLVDREVDFTSTIDRYRFDVLGRVVRHERGTVETGTGANMHPVSSVAYDAVNYGTNGTGNLNIAGGNGLVTRVFQHPAGAFDAANDIHSNIRYDALGNPVNLWSDEGPFLASAVDNLGRTTAAAAFDGVLAEWNSALVPVGDGSTTVGLRKRHAENFYDELGRVYRQANFAVDPATGALSALSSGDTVRTDYFRGANGAMKYVSGTSQTMIARDRLCQVKTQATVASAWATGTPDVSEAAAGNLASQVVIAQTNYVRDSNHHNVIATVSAQRGTADVSSTGAVTSGTAPPIRGPLIDIPGTSTQGWLSMAFNGTDLQWGLRTNVSAPRLKLKVWTTEFDRWLDVPAVVRDFGDPLRHQTPYWKLCCGVNCGDLFPDTSTVYPFMEKRVQYDPRQLLNMAVTTDWESGEQTVNANLFNPAGQPVQSMALKRHVSPTDIGLPGLPTDVAPLVPESSSCCDRADRVERLFDKGRLKLEKMFPCDQPDGNPSTPGFQFNPLSPSSFCSAPPACPKVTSYGYPDYPTEHGEYYPHEKDPTVDLPNDNNLPSWYNRPVGESPDVGWPNPIRDRGENDADWFVYDYLGRKVRTYNQIYRRPNFGDGAAVSGQPCEFTFWSRRGLPTEVRRPSGDHTKPWDHETTQYDMLGRPKRIFHILGDYGASEGSSPDWDDQHELSYDRFGLLSEYKQKYKGMYPGSCSGPLYPVDGWITTKFEREGTPQQSVHIDGRPLTPWQGPRVVRQELPAGKELGMAYFPNPGGSGESGMFPGGVDDLLSTSRLDWALGRTSGLFEGNGTDHFELPVSMYGYLGMVAPTHRFLPQVNLHRWQNLLTTHTPTGDGAGGGLVPLHIAPDWRHRLRNDVWGREIDTTPNSALPQLPAVAEGHQDIRWMAGQITSMLDPATSPYFGVASGVPNDSPVPDFPIHGHDEYFRRDCKGRTIYWLSGRASAFDITPPGGKSARTMAEETWLNGHSLIGATSKTGNDSAAASFNGVTEIEMRWPDQPTGCNSTGGNGGWLIAPDGMVNHDYPLWPRSPGAQSEWATNDGLSLPGAGGCLQNPNSRTGQAHRWLTPSGGGTPTEFSGWPFFHQYDAAGNLRDDGRHFYWYDGSNRLRDVYLRGVDPVTGAPVQGNKLAHFDYDALGRHIKSVYNSNGDGSLDDEDVEWTPRDPLGRPIGIWRQGPVSGGSRPCAKPYQLFGYHSTGLRGTGYDASGGILDCPAVRWRDTNGDGTFDESLTYLQDFRGDITALVDAKNGIVERVRYGLTGRPEVFPAADIDFSGTVDSGDLKAFEGALEAFNDSAEKYDPRADLTHDGVINSDDESSFFASYDRFGGLSGNWKLSQGDGLTPGHTGEDAGLDNRFGWRGYWYDGRLQKYHVRNRVYDPREGRWMQNDPLGFGAGDQDLYRYCFGEYSTGYDPEGLMPWYDEALDWVGNAGAGLGDGLSFGITNRLRGGIDAVTGAGLNDVVDTGSTTYRVTAVTGAVITTVATGGAASAAGAGAVTVNAIVGAGLTATIDGAMGNGVSPENAALGALLGGPGGALAGRVFQFLGARAIATVMASNAGRGGVAGTLIAIGAENRLGNLLLSPEGVLNALGRWLGVGLAGAEGAGCGAGTGPIRAGQVMTYEDFVERSVIGDGIEGHELWQFANQRANGLASSRLASAASRGNPVVGLERPVHQAINAAQRVINAAGQTPIDNINANAELLRRFGILPESTIAKLQQMATEHAKRLGFRQ